VTKERGDERGEMKEKTKEERRKRRRGQKTSDIKERGDKRGVESHSQVHDGIDYVVVVLLEGPHRLGPGNVGLGHHQLDVLLL